MPKITIYSTQLCPYCKRAKVLLTQKQVEYDEVLIDKDPEQRDRMIEASGRHTVPQIFIGEYHVGGFDDLWALEQQGKLDQLLQSED